MNWLLLLYREKRGLEARSPPAWLYALARGAAERSIVAMAVDFHPEAALLVPAAFAIWFMLWVLWHWWKEERR